MEVHFSRASRFMAQTARRWFLIAAVRVLTQDSLLAIYGGRSGTVKDFSLSTSMFPYQCHSTNVLYSFIHQSSTESDRIK
jgi:hypothetical protein